MNVKEELIVNVDHYKDLLSKELLKRAELLKFEDKCFHDEIESQFLFVIRYTIAEDLGKRFGTNTEEVIVALEDMDLKGLLC